MACRKYVQPSAVYTRHANLAADAGCRSIHSATESQLYSFTMICSRVDSPASSAEKYWRTTNKGDICNRIIVQSGGTRRGSWPRDEACSKNFNNHRKGSMTIRSITPNINLSWSDVSSSPSFIRFVTIRCQLTSL